MLLIERKAYKFATAPSFVVRCQKRLDSKSMNFNNSSTSFKSNEEGKWKHRLSMIPVINSHQNEKSFFCRQILNEILPQGRDLSKMKLCHRIQIESFEPQRSHSHKEKIANHYKTHSLSAIDEKIKTQTDDITIRNNNSQVVYKSYLQPKAQCHHNPNNKFIANFLTPMNKFISKDFHLQTEEYEQMVTNANLQIKTISFTDQSNSIKRKGKLPPKCPTVLKTLNK